MYKISFNIFTFFIILCIAFSCGKTNEEVILRSKYSNVQPMTGIVFWADNENNNTDAISMEFSYMLYSDVIVDENVYDWTVVEYMLNSMASRGHQGILRFRFTYPGYETAVPQYIKNIDNYNETVAQSENKTTWFPDWSNQELKDFTLDFYTAFSKKYDNDSRLAFLQVGFGLWAEYHIYDGPQILGQTFPSKDFQEIFLKHIDSSFKSLKWSISIDAASKSVGPFTDVASLKDIEFGLFDDSFMSEEHGSWNELMWNFFDRDRYERSPAGGEFSYYSDYVQKNVLRASGAYGESYESFAKRFHITYMIGNDQASYQSLERIKQASIASGYMFEVFALEVCDGQTKVWAKNIGVAPIYYDAYFSIKGTRSNKSLKSLLPGMKSVFVIDQTGDNNLVISCDRLLPSQSIQFIKSY